ncbi:molybdate ABC transporter substrate-binding protein [Candidatus Poribacteria bacterium]|nr:MAG: molybdate ABC transporter substrate-binding protein [Candidatus Poribacteria bacterium]
MASEQLSVAVATNFVPVMQRLVAEHKTKTGISARITSGSTGKLVAQVLLGAPHDLFFSADQERVATLINEDVADAETRITYAIGRIVYWAPSNDFGDLSFENAFLASNPSTIALANAKLAPYGAAAERTLSEILEGQHTRPKFVTAENVGQVFAIVATGNSPAGFVALSAVTGNPDVDPRTYVVVPSSMHQPIKQDAIILNRSKLKEQAIAFLNFVRGNQGRQIIARFGYDLP